MIAWLRRVSAADRVAILYTAVYFACLGARAAGLVIPVVLDVAFYPLGLVVAWAGWRNSRFAWLDRRTRLAWRLLAVSAIILWISGSVWTVWVGLRGRDVYADLIDRAAFGQYVLAITAYLLFPGSPVPRRSLPRFGLDVLLLAVAGFVIAFHVGLRILVLEPSVATTTALVESSFDWALFVAASIGCMQKRNRVVRQVLFLLLTSNLLSLIGNFSVAVQADYRNGDPVDGLWFAAWVLRWAAARIAWYHYTAVEEGRESAVEAPPEYRGNPFSYVLVAGAFLLLFVQVLAGREDSLEMLAGAAMGMAVLLVLRQYAEIRENQRLLQAQLERESRFSSLVTHSSDLVLVIDGRGRVTYVSPALPTVFGEDVRLAPGTRLHDLLKPEAATELSALLAQGSSGTPRFEAQVQVAPGRWRDVEAAWTDLREDPSVRGIVVNCRDVTDRNAIEQHLRHVQKLDAMSHVAGGLAHDLNNVLTIIRGYSELLKSDVDESSGPARDLEQMMEAVDRAASVTQKVLAFSRKQPATRKVLDVNAVVRDVEPMLRQLMPHDVDVRLELPPGVWPVRADQGQLEQVLVNLATNARDAMPDGGTVEVATANRALAGDPDDPRNLPAGDYVSITVRDQGCGMTPDVLSRIAEPFFSTKPKDRGLGLGLSIVHGIVSDFDGKLEVESAVNRGSSLTVLLPRADTAAAALASAAR